MVAKIIVLIWLIVLMVLTMRGTFKELRNGDKVYTLVCSYGSTILGLLAGFILGSLFKF